MPAYAFGDSMPVIDRTSFVAPGAMIVGDVVLGPRSSVWFNAVVRGDSAPVRVGGRTNVQDGAVLHTDAGSPGGLNRSSQHLEPGGAAWVSGNDSELFSCIEARSPHRDGRPWPGGRTGSSSGQRSLVA